MLVRVPFHNKGFICSADVVKRRVFGNTKGLVVNRIRGARDIFVVHEIKREGGRDGKGKGKEETEKRRIETNGGNTVMLMFNQMVTRSFDCYVSTFFGLVYLGIMFNSFHLVVRNKI